MLRILLLACVLSLPWAAHAAKRVALIIGNDAYEEVTPLHKAVADANAVAAKVTRAGYDIVLSVNADRRSTNLAISRFTTLLEPGDIALVFYAGHGVQIDGENYLLPTDIAAPNGVTEGFITSESIPLSDLLDRIRRTGARTTLAIVDACRDNPFATATGRSIGGTRGLARIAAPEGTFVLFSAGAGQQALDRLSDTDTDANSVFTRTLLPKLDQPGLELRDMIFELREEVRKLAQSRNHQQFPAYYDELSGDFFIHSASAVTAPVGAPGPPTTTSGNIRADFDLARSIGTRDAYARFIDTYNDHNDQFVVTVARDLMAALPQTEEPATVPAAPGTDRRAIMRATQVELNRLGCDAGGADGIAGRRTRAAFAAYLQGSNAGLTGNDLGTPQALAALRTETGTICKLPMDQADDPSIPPSTKGPSLVGTWRFVANCPLFITTTGTSRIRSAGGASVTGTAQDSLGQALRISGTTAGRNFTIFVRSDSASATENGTLSADGKSYTSQNSLGCRITAKRIG
ncbi:MAG: caspase family protein [Silicimonas sp.]|nr:caspase family protein [Silicimonas sp.]